MLRLEESLRAEGSRAVAAGMLPLPAPASRRCHTHNGRRVPLLFEQCGSVQASVPHPCAAGWARDDPNANNPCHFSRPAITLW